MPLFQALILTLFVAGCASTGGGGGFTLKQTRLDVGWKMEAYQEAVTFGSVTQGQKQQVSAAYQVYQAAFHQALSAAGGNLGAPAPANVRQLATELIATVDSVLATLADQKAPSAIPNNASRHQRPTIAAGTRG